MMAVKTTFDLPETLVADVKRIARARGTTSRELVRQALIRLVDEDSTPAKPFKLRDMSVTIGWPADLDDAELNRLIRESNDREIKW
jgi:metal-responsive CopG/Arc/MetJ family transcriptional regulator